MAAGEDTRRPRAGAKKRDAGGVEAAAVDPNDDSFRLLSITPTRAPSGFSGSDWLVYRIAQGENIITGYRQGDLKSATAEVETIVKSLNERRGSTKTKPGRKAGGGAAASQQKDESKDDSKDDSSE